MKSYFLTGIAALLLGVGIGVYLGWVQFPVEYRNSHLCQLRDDYQAAYTLMVARGYRQDRDLDKALDRLRPLRVADTPACRDGRDYEIDNLPDWVQTLTERYISEGANPDEIRDLVALAEGFDRLTPIMESFRSPAPTLTP
jgi:hypothetical protein